MNTGSRASGFFVDLPRRLGLIILWALTCMIPLATARAQQPVSVCDASELPALAYYQLDGLAQWQLADHALTQAGGTPTNPAALYLQFGSVSCAPCHELAAWIGPQLPPSTLAVYGHVDEVELVENGVPLGRMLRQLNEQLSGIAAYARFLTVTNVPMEVVRDLTGGTGLPGGLFILPDGRHTVFTRFDRALIALQLQWWLLELEGM
jgi:mono/diheme cytochrome c family protein